MAQEFMHRERTIRFWIFTLCILAVEVYSSTELRTRHRGTYGNRGLLGTSRPGEEVRKSTADLLLLYY